MSLIEWKDEFSVGIPDVDHEHRELIGLINQLHESLIQPGPDDNIAEFLGEIFARISAHFALEEKVMRQRGYDQYLDHKEDHEKLLDEIRDIMDNHELKGQYSDTELSSHLKHWFADHFKHKDARLHKHLDQGYSG